MHMFYQQLQHRDHSYNCSHKVMIYGSSYYRSPHNYEVNYRIMPHAAHSSIIIMHGNHSFAAIAALIFLQ